MEWDWIGPDSPLMSGLSESEWLLERLCESLIRLAKKPYAPTSERERERGDEGVDGEVVDGMDVRSEQRLNGAGGGAGYAAPGPAGDGEGNARGVTWEKRLE